MRIFDEPKIDCHNHIFDPARFPYRADTHYRPAGPEVGSAALFMAVMDAHGVRRALVVGPNSGYGDDNRCLLDAIARSGGRLSGVAVVDHDVSLAALKDLQARGIVGIAFNPALLGVAHYLPTGPLLKKLCKIGMFLQIQVEHDQLVDLLPLVDRPGLRLLIDHCGRPRVEAGLRQPGFEALLALGRTGRAFVKLSGFAKFSRTGHPHEDAWPYVAALVDAFTLDRCVWGSDWPYLRSVERVDYGVQLALIERLFPHPADRARLLWETPRQLLDSAA